MANEGYALWFAELKSPTPEDRRADRSTDPKLLSGFWKILGARTKIDWPLSIWSDQGQDATIFQIGRRVMNTVDHQTEWQEFAAQSWLNTVAVTQAEWDKALSTGWWSDGKVARSMSAEERMGLELPSGGNAPPLEESLADQIQSVADSASIEVTDQASADKAAGILDRLRLLLGKAEDARKEAKAPILLAGREIDAHWNGISEPGTMAKTVLEKRVKAWLLAEQKRIAAERKAAEDAERQRLADEETARRAQEAQQQGLPEPDPVKPEEVTPPPPAAPVERPRASSTYGRATGLRKVKRGQIDDLVVFVSALAEMKHAELIELAQKLADRAAKAGVPVRGMQIVEVLE